MAMLTVWSDLTDPWAYVVLLRLHRARDRAGADDLDFELRSLLADPRPDHEVVADVGALAQLDPGAFSLNSGPRWPGSGLLAHEAQKWGFSVGQEIGERFDLALRRAIFLHGHVLDLPGEIAAVAEREGLDAGGLSAALGSGRHRAEVSGDAAEAEQAGVTASPTVVLPDGTAHHNPGLEVKRVRGLALIGADHPSVYEDLVRVASID